MTTETTALTLPERAAVAIGAAAHEQAILALAVQAKEITTITNKDGYQQCHATRMSLKNARVEVQKKGKAAREDATAFSKAVIAEEQRLVKLIEPEETRLGGLQEQWDAAREAERQEALRVERERVEAVKARITAIHDRYLNAVTLDACGVGEVLGAVTGFVVDASFAEFQGDALQTKAATVEKLTALLATKQAQEAEAQRQEAERIAREQAAAAERQRLAEERAAADQERAKLAAERAELERQQAAAQAALKAQQEELARQQAALAAQQAEAERQAREAQEAAERQAAAVKAEEERQARAEADRVAAIRQTITQLRERAMQREVVAGNAAAVESAIATLAALRIAEVDFGEFTSDAEAAREEALAVLRELRGAKVAQEAEADRHRVGVAFEPVKAALALVGAPVDGEDRLRAALLARIRADLECLDNAMLARVAEFAEHLVEKTGGRKAGGVA